MQNELTNQNCDETHAVFRIIGEGFNPSNITKKIHITPDYEYHAELAIPENRHGLRAKTNIWSISSEKLTDSTSLAYHIELLLERLAGSSEYIKEFKAAGFRVEFHCYWMSKSGHGGPILSSELLCKIMDYDADLDFDFYCAE